MILVIDNYDSFVYNLVQLLGAAGERVVVVRNDALSVAELIDLAPDKVVISPGPGTPEQAGVSVELVRRLQGRVPVLGVCLGHQVIAAAYGGKVVRAPQLMHGKTSLIFHHGDALFAGVPSPFEATRYHSLLVSRQDLPACLAVTAETADGIVMAIRHREHPVLGVQFHPESILTRHGRTLIENFLADRPAAVRVLPGGEAGGALAPAVDFKAVLAGLARGEDLSEQAAEQAMEMIMAGAVSPAQVAAFLTALRLKGESVAEIAGSARAMRRAATVVPTRRTPIVDTCGTGGDNSGSFNISTTAAFVVAGAGLAVAKHGNRSVSSKSGSADVLEALGICLTLTPEQVGRCIDEVGLGFLFAPALHASMQHASGPRREIGFRSIFNILGPLTNPAGAHAQLMGVYARDLTEPLAGVLGRLGSRHGFVVHGEDGLDEISISAPTQISEVSGNQVRTYRICPEDLGVRSAPKSCIQGGDARTNALITAAVLLGEKGARRDVVVLNAAAALVAGGAAADLPAGARLAERAIDTGAAARVLEGLRRMSHQMAS